MLFSQLAVGWVLPTVAAAWLLSPHWEVEPFASLNCAASHALLKQRGGSKGPTDGSGACCGPGGLEQMLVVYAALGLCWAAAQLG